MLKKLFIAALLLVLTSTANATLIEVESGIDGTFDLGGFATITTADTGQITEIVFDNLYTANPNDDDDYSGLFSMFTFAETPNPLVLSNIVNAVVFKVAGFTFTVTSILDNSFSIDGGLVSANLFLIGDMMHESFITTSSQLHFSTQGLILGGETTNKSFSMTVTSPAPEAVPEPGALAIFALALVGFAVNRKRKSA